MAEQRSGYFYGWLQVASLVLGIIGGSVALYFTMQSHKTVLHATIFSGTYHEHPRYQRYVDRILGKVSPVQLQILMENMEDDSAPVGAVRSNAWRDVIDLNRLSSEFTQQLELDSAFEFPPLSYWEAEVINNGDVTLTDVKIRLPGALGAIVSRTYMGQAGNVEGAINIGNLEAGERVDIVAWTDAQGERLDAKVTLALYHSTGRGTIDRLVKKSSDYYIIYASIAVSFLATCVFWLIFFYVHRNRKARRRQ